MHDFEAENKPGLITICRLIGSQEIGGQEIPPPLEKISGPVYQLKQMVTTIAVSDVKEYMRIEGIQNAAVKYTNTLEEAQEIIQQMENPD